MGFGNSKLAWLVHVHGVQFIIVCYMFVWVNHDLYFILTIVSTFVIPIVWNRVPCTFRVTVLAWSMKMHEQEIYVYTSKR